MTVERAADVRQAVILGEGRIIKKELKGLTPAQLLPANTVAVTDAPLQQVSFYSDDYGTHLDGMCLD